MLGAIGELDKHVPVTIDNDIYGTTAGVIRTVHRGESSPVLVISMQYLPQIRTVLILTFHYATKFGAGAGLTTDVLIRGEVIAHYPWSPHTQERLVIVRPIPSQLVTDPMPPLFQ